MDPTASLKELQGIVVSAKVPSRVDRERANELIDALRVWVRCDGYDPPWYEYPEAAHVVRSGGYYLVGR